MTRNLKALGLALVAVFAMSAVVAAGASAANFNSESSPTIFTGTQTTANIFTTNTGAKVECEEAHFEGTTNVGTTMNVLVVKPTYGKCKFAGEAVTVYSSGCIYSLDADTTSGLGHAELFCAENGRIEVDGKGCDLTFSSQDFDGGVEYTNQGSGTGRDVLVTWKATGLDFTKHGSPLLCAFAGKEATYTGTVTTKGYKDEGGTKGAQQGVFWEL